MTIILYKDGILVSDSSVTQYGGMVNAFSCKKGFLTEDRKFYIIGAGSLSTIQEVQEHVDERSEKFSDTVTVLKNFTIKPDDETQIHVFNKDEPTLYYTVTSNGITKIPREVSFATGVCELYFKGLLDFGIPPVTVVNHVLNNGLINTLSYPLFVFNTDTFEEWIIDENGGMEIYDD